MESRPLVDCVHDDDGHDEPEGLVRSLNTAYPVADDPFLPDRPSVPAQQQDIPYNSGDALKEAEPAKLEPQPKKISSSGAQDKGGEDHDAEDSDEDCSHDSYESDGDESYENDWDENEEPEEDESKDEGVFVEEIEDKGAAIDEDTMSSSEKWAYEMVLKMELLGDANTQLEIENARLELENEGLQKDLSHSRAVNSNLKAQVGELESDMSLMEDENWDLQGDIDRLGDARRLDAKVRQRGCEVRQLEDQNRELHLENKRKEDVARSLREDVGRLRSQLVSDEAYWDRILDMHEEADLAREIKVLKTENKELEQAYGWARGAAQETSTNFHKLKAAVWKLKEKATKTGSIEKLADWFETW
ncbi:hypothetical protein F4808DRAFT_454820 [Astrocystis sublimbata]|nr:hypothetical protein F4808DRAFT_454820 [Astrocystis sublimbata]